MGNKVSFQTDCDVAVIGGGASGLFAAITAADSGKRISLFESGDRVGKKILMTGNGKCNLSHTDISCENYYGSGKKYIENFLNVFGTGDAVSFFKEAGMLIRDKDGYLYPYTENAQTVVDILRFCLEQKKADIHTSCKIIKISKDEYRNSFVLTDEVGRTYSSSKVILCTGGKAYPKTGSDGSGYKLASEFGLEMSKVRPALCKLISDESICKGIDGVRAKGNVCLYINDVPTASEKGEIQFTKDGLSGIPIFNISRIASYAVSKKQKVNIGLDITPDFSYEELVDFYLSKSRNGLTAENFFLGAVNKKINSAVMNICNLKFGIDADLLGEKEISAFCRILKDFRFNITGVYGFDSAQVSAGGICFDELNDKLEVKKCPGLFLAGEILDIDGICGGYNLQWAWTSGYIAGRNASV